MTGGGGGAAAATLIAKAGSDALRDPSLTLITIPESVPTSAAAGVPLNWPVAVLNAAHDGLPTMEKTSFAPDESEAAGWNRYAFATVALVPGVPEIVGGGGGVLSAATVIAKAGSDALAVPSLTLITIPGSVPTSAAGGVPLSSPVAVLNVAQEGLPVTAKVSALPLASEALGRNV
jgi:hypothetical protein